jgi:predicted NBD/HSP70 family sugar kinase
VPFTEVFAELDLRRPGSTAVDVDALSAVVQGGDALAGRTSGALADAVSGVLLAALAFSDPQLIVLGGPWAARLPVFLEALRLRIEAWPRTVPVTLASLLESPELVGARMQALEMLRSAIVETARESSAPAE